MSENNIYIDGIIQMLRSLDLSKYPCDEIKKLFRQVGKIPASLSIRKQMEPILSYISVSSLAKDYFGTSASWFYQRLNGNTVHGKTAAFTEKEIQILNEALKEIGAKIMNMSVAV